MNPTAARARDLALKRHRREVNMWKTLALVSLPTSVAIGAIAGVLSYRIDRSLDRMSRHTDHMLETIDTSWRTDFAPVGEPYWVVTKAYVRKHDRQWCSFDNGEPITVSHWTTAQP